MKKPNIMLIGCGPHAKRVYLPILKQTEKKYNTKVKVIVELKRKEKETSEFVKKFFSDVKLLYVEEFYKTNIHTLPKTIENKLNKFIREEKINGVIIATDPLNHMQYALWAQKKGLHILMDKPISTYENICNNITQAQQLKSDYKLLMENYSYKKAFIINSQRRFLPQFEIIQEKINEISRKYGIPVTSMQSTHCDGQWRLPKEILEIKYHPLLGWGKVSHSGYHFIDMASKIIKDSYKYANKTFDEISVFSKFIRPSGVLMQQTQEDLVKIFGNKYITYDNRSNEELLNLYKINNEAEVDATALISLLYKDIPITNITLNLIHNGFSRRSWMIANTKDLYKGNGRLRHEYHNIQQGCIQNIQIHSYQSSDKQNRINTDEDFLVGGNNHYDIYLFRNVGITGGKAFEKISAKEISKQLINELAQYKAVTEFLEIVIEKKKPLNVKSNIIDHYLSVQLMSMIYESEIKHKEIKQTYDDRYTKKKGI